MWPAAAVLCWHHASKILVSLVLVYVLFFFVVFIHFGPALGAYVSRQAEGARALV
jgi:hypothetical protein